MPFIMVDDCKMYFTVKGQGIPILFIHPPLLTHFNFEYQLKELSQYFQVIAFDIRGHGRSSSSAQPLSYPLIADDIRKLLDHLSIRKVFVCGYSTGGSIALEFLLSNSDRAWGGIVISGMSEVSDPSLKNKIGFAIVLAKLNFLSPLAVSTSWSNTATPSSFLQMFKEERKGTARNIEEYYRYSLSYNCTNRLKYIKKPILIVYGQKDKVFSRYAKLMHEELTLSELKEIGEVKHQLPTKVPSEMNHLIKEFIYKQKQSFPTNEFPVK